MLKPLLTIGALQLAAMLVMLLRTKLLALFLGPEGVGLMAVIDKLLALFVQGLSLSLPFAALRFLPELWRNDRAACYAAWRRMAAAIVLLALVVALAGAAVSLGRSTVWGSALAAQPWTLAVAFASLPALALWPLLQNAYAGTMRHSDSMLFLLAHSALLAITGAIGALAGSLTLLYASYAVAAWPLLAFATRHLVQPMRPAGGLPWRGWRDAVPETRVLRFSLALSGLSVLAPFAALYTHYWILEQQGARDAGWMQAAIGVSLAVRGVLGAAHQVYLTPQLNSRVDWTERMAWAGHFQHAWCLLAAVLVPPLLLGAEWAVRLLYADSFVPATGFVALFVLTEVIGMLAGTYQGLIVAADRMRFHVAQNAAAQLLLLGVAWLTIPRWGIAGAALGPLAAQCFLLVCTLGYLRLRMGQRPDARVGALMLYLVLALLACGWIGASGLTTDLPSLARAALVYLALAAGLLLFINAEERRRWTGALAQVWRARGRP
jgi:O-antigen/teichoic acid export membrane protein